MANTTKTPVQIMNTVRPDAFKNLVKAMTMVYGEENIFQTGDSEIAVKVDTSPDGKPIYATYSPTIKNYTDRKTSTKMMTAYDAPAVAKKYAESVKKKEEEAAKNAEIKAKKTAKDKADREKRAAKIAEAKAKKKEGETA
jgi:hypothetical protein